MRKYLLLSILIIIFFVNGCNGSNFDEFDKEEIINNPNLCNKLKGDNEYLCYGYVALQKRDIDLCDKIKSEDLKIECQEELADTVSDPEKCKELGDPKKGEFSARSMCYESIAFQTDNLELCNFVGPTDEECEDLRVYAKQYADESELSNMDESISQCKEESVARKNFCFTEIAAKRNDITVCDENIIHVDTYPDYTPFCYDRVAKSKKDLSLCKHIDCVRDVSIETQNPDSCFKIDNEKYSNDVRIFTWSDRLANKGFLNRTEEKNRCFLGIFASDNFVDVSICSHMVKLREFDDSQYNCVMNIVSRTFNIKDCETIPVTTEVGDHYLFSLGDSVDIEDFFSGLKKLDLVPARFLIPESIKDVVLQPRKNNEYDVWKITTDDPDEWWEIHYIFDREKISFFGPLGSLREPYASGSLDVKMTTESPYKIDIYFRGGFLDCEEITILDDGSKQLKNCEIPSLFNKMENRKLECYELVTKKKGYEECLKVSDEKFRKYKNECLYRAAKELNSDSPCELIRINGQNVNSCKEYASYLIENYKGYSMSAEYSVTAGLIRESDALTEG